MGWHFLYEGIWKIRHADAFVAETEGFLSGARGPLAGVFYSMIPDIDGHRRLEGDLTQVEAKDAAGNPTTQPKLAKRWDEEVRQRFVDYYRPADGKEETKNLHKELGVEAQKVYARHVHGLNEFIQENGDKIEAHFESLKRCEEGRKTDPHTVFQTQRRWDEMQDLRKEAKGWISDLDSRENALKGDLLDLLRKDRKSEVDAVTLAKKKTRRQRPRRRNPTKKPLTDQRQWPTQRSSWSTSAPWPRTTWKTAPSPAVRIRFPGQRIEQLAFLLTWALTAIGLCLMLGLFTRPAALAGAGFMLFVVLSQPSYPFVIPADPPQLGHALLVNKDFVEMVALLVIASTTLGRWTGLDFFLHKFLIKPSVASAATPPRRKDEKHEQFPRSIAPRLSQGRCGCRRPDGRRAGRILLRLRRGDRLAGPRGRDRHRRRRQRADRRP